MVIWQNRRSYNKAGNYIIGKLELGSFTCDTLENYEKVCAEGFYDIRRAYHDKFKCDVLEVLEVPGRTGILIHPGNTQKDTEGCILVGQNTVKGEVLESRDTLTKLLEEYEKYKDTCQQIYISSKGDQTNGKSNV